MAYRLLNLPIRPPENRLMDHLSNLYLDAGIVTPASFRPTNLRILPIKNPQDYYSGVNPTGTVPYGKLPGEF